jgi:hypothetical protein
MQNIPFVFLVMITKSGRFKFSSAALRQSGGELFYLVVLFALSIGGHYRAPARRRKEG